MSDGFFVVESVTWYSNPDLDPAEWDGRFADALITGSGCIPPRRRTRFGAWLYTLLTRRPA